MAEGRYLCAFWITNTPPYHYARLDTLDVKKGWFNIKLAEINPDTTFSLK